MTPRKPPPVAHCQHCNRPLLLVWGRDCCCNTLCPGKAKR